MSEINLERAYHNNTLEVIDTHLVKENDFLAYLRKDARQHNKEMFEETSHDYSDVSTQVELSQYLQSFSRNEMNLKASTSKVEKLIKMREKPYFGRLDFTEDGYDTEKLYIGISHLFDNETLDIMVYDWRSPIASLYYDNKYGRLSYESPSGTVFGDVSLKRQFLFDNDTVEDYFDLKDNVIDTQLLEVLSGQGEQKLHSVVETIQEKQNAIIRTADIDLLFVKGVPGSGKSIIAMHRVAYLMYHGQKTYNSKNMLIISPNQFFKQYIDEVLPELGEQSVDQRTYEDLMIEIIGDHIETYAQHMDRVVRQRISQFKNTKSYFILLEKWFKYYLETLHPYEDIYYNNQTIVKREHIKNWYLRHLGKTPLNVGADQFRAKSYSSQEYLQREVKEKLREVTMKLGNHPLHTGKVVNRKMQVYNRMFKSHLKSSLKLTPRRIYEKMFEHKDILRSLVDFDIPDDFFNRNNLYEDFHGIMLFHSWIHPINDYKHFKYIVIDESQDYNYVQLHLLKHVFSKGHFTILGDMNQTLHHEKQSEYHKDLEKIFKPKEMKMIELETCYRSTRHITEYASQYINTEVKAFSREGQAPKLITTEKPTYETQKQIKEMADLATIAVIVHTSSEANKLSKKLNVPAITGYHTTLNHPVVVLPIYYAKGLEFDGVIYINNQKHHPLHQQFAYTASTRAKHKLTIIEKSNQN